MARRTRLAAVLTLAMINVFTLAAGITVARMLPPRLAALKVPTVAAKPVSKAGPVLAPANRNGTLPTTNGLRSALAGPLSAAALGPQVSAVVADPGSGKILWSQDPDQLATPASTTKLVTSAAALAALGPGATFTTKVVRGATNNSVILVGGGDPTLAVHPFPPGQYPRPATLAGLAKAAARALKAQGQSTVSLGYDDGLYTGPGLAPGWPAAYVSTGNVTPISALEVDQGRLTTAGEPEDSDDPYNLRARTSDPAGLAAAAFAALLKADGIHVTGTPAGQQAKHNAKILASIQSPPLAAIVQQMLQESNNVIAENLARQVAISQPPARVVQRRRHRRDRRAEEPRRQPQRPAPGRRQRPVPAGQDRARCPGQGAPAGHQHPEYPPPPSRPAGGGLLRHAVGRAERIRRHRRPGAGRGPGQDRQPGHGDHPGRPGHRQDRENTDLRLHGRQDPGRGDAQRGREGHQRGGRRAGQLRLPVTGAGSSTYRWTVSSTQMIDWDVAISTGTRWARPGPQVSLAEARRTVSELRDLAGAVQQPVYEVTGMSATRDHTLGRVAVVDRPGWIRANVDGFRVVLEPLVEQLRERAPGGAAAGKGGGVMTAVGSRVTGIQAGLILAYLSSRVLGQYELFLPPETSPVDGEQPGRLTLVAPNIVMVERELGVDTHDFRRWVCLHEETHRLQFTAVPWLRDYVQSQMTEFLLASELDPAAILQRIRSAADAMAGAVRGGDGGSLIDAVATPKQKEIMDRLTSVMTLVEGHGDYVMDAVGPQVVPSVEQIRERFNSRRGSSGRVEQTIRRILGIDLKMKQYAEGSRFVKAVVDEVGMADFNKVWTSPETLPTREEFAHPHKWVERVVSGA